MAAIPDVVDVCRSRGDSFSDEFTVTTAAGAVVDISGAIFLLTVDPEPDPTTSAANLFQLTGVITDASNGVFTMTPSTSQTDVTPDLYFYDIQMTDAGGVVRTIAKGEYLIEQDITK